MTEGEEFQDEQSFMKCIFMHTHAQTHTARLNNLEVEEVGLHSPLRATARLRTPTAEEKTIYLFYFSVLLFVFFPLSS